jgi:hypothetical protein
MIVIISRIKTYYQSYWSKVQSKECKPMPLSRMPGEGSNLWLYDYEGNCISSIPEIIKGHYGGIFLSLGRNILVHREVYVYADFVGHEVVALCYSVGVVWLAIL